MEFAQYLKIRIFGIDTDSMDQNLPWMIQTDVFTATVDGEFVIREFPGSLYI